MLRLPGLSTTRPLNLELFSPTPPAARRRSSMGASTGRQVVALLMCLVILTSLLVGCASATTTTPTPTGGGPLLLYSNDGPPSIGVVPSSAWPGAVCGNARYLLDSQYMQGADWGYPYYQVTNDPTPWEWTPADFSGAPYSAAEGSPDELGRSGVMAGTIVYEPSGGPEPGVSSEDLPFTHPFVDSSGSINDFEYFVAPDTLYQNEITSGNGAGADPSGEYAPAYAAAKAAPFNFKGSGVLGTEVPSALVPKPYRAPVGSRIAQWGDWIVDCGHTPYHTEAMHLPLFTATAQALSAASGAGPGTSVQLLGNPYVVSQVCFDNVILTQSYTDDPICHPNDTHGIQGCTDGETGNGEGRDLFDHLICELNHDLSAPDSNVMNAKADIYTVPVDSPHIMTFFVDAPPSPGSGYSLQLQYNLTIRDGVTIDLHQDGKPNELAVTVTMNPNGYAPAPLRPGVPTYLTWSQLEAMDAALPSSVVSSLNQLCSGLLEGGLSTCGIWVTQYSNVYPSKFDSPIDFSSGASQLLSGFKSTGSGLGIQVDDSQPFPIIGGIRLQWVSCGTPTSCARVGPAPLPIHVTPTPQPLRVLGIGTRVSPSPTNNCIGSPLTFTATVVTNGEQGPVTYQWVTSDGTTTQPVTINIAQGTSTVSVSTKWAPSTAGTHWAELKILSPQPAAANTLSSRAYFQMVLC